MARPKKKGARTKSGRISRSAINYDKGTERAQAMQILYGPDGCDAIGRAFRSGLLGEAQEAKPLLDLSRKVARLYWRAYETGAVRSCIGERTHGLIVDIDHERVRRDEEWLNETLKIINRMGVRRSFDQLVIDWNPDHGPVWLDEMLAVKSQQLFAKQHKRVIPEMPKRLTDKLRGALDGLEAIA